MCKFTLEIDGNDLQEQIKELPVINAEVINLYFINKKTTFEIAAQLQLPVTVIRRHLGKGIYLIKKNTGCFEEAFRIMYGDRIIISAGDRTGTRNTF